MLKKQFLISFLSVLTIGLIGIISIPILTRLLVPEEIGKLFIILAIVSILQVFDGFKPVITFFLNRNKLNEVITLNELKKANSLFIISISSFIFFISYFYTFSLINSLLYTLVFIFYSMMSFYWGVLDTKNEVNYTSILRTIGWIMAYLLFILFAYIKLNIEYYALSILLMYIILYISFKIKLKKLNIILKPDYKFNNYSKLLRIIIKEVINNIKIQINAIFLLTIDKFIVPFFTGYANFAFYAVQSELATKTYLINATWKRVLYPYLAKKENIHKIGNLLNYLSIIFLVSLILCIIIGLYSENLITLYAGESYNIYSNLFSLLILVFPLNIIGTFGVTILHINGNFELHNKIYKYFAFFHLINLSLLTYYFGITGAAIALVMSRMVDLFLFLTSIKLYVKNISNITILSCLFIFLTIIATTYFNKSLISILLSILLYAILFKITKVKS
jgi:O-antigen/teichoic acid export membrane protein